MITIVPSVEHTQQWRASQSWYTDGKQNECEWFQQQCLRQITGYDLLKNTNMRLHLETKELLYQKNPLALQDGFEYTEDFDTCLKAMNYCFYFNLKFVCSVGGSQYRTLRETYHFIQTQLEHLVLFPDPSHYFINILDGNCSHQSKTKFEYLWRKEKYRSVQQQVFIGDMFQFQQFWHNFFPSPPQEKTITMKNKQQWGQFFTTHYQYILQNLYIPEGVTHILEPFAGAGDLLKFLPDKSSYTVECYDIEPQHSMIIQRDTFSNPPCFQGKFVLTNPPYLARNKSKEKQVFHKYGANDLYKCFLRILIQTPCQGGILIVPVNFWCSPRDMELRKQFLQQYKIVHVNIFEEPVFQDTDYAVCSFLFLQRTTCSTTTTNSIPIMLFPEKKNLELVLNEENKYMMGGEIFQLPRTYQYSITRRTRLNKDKPFTKILVKCIDDEKPIQLSITETSYVDETPHLSARSYATLVIEPTLPEEQQSQLVERFNQFLTEYREKYHSLFLTTYREYQRKRISFDLVYQIVGHLLEFSKK